MATSYSDSSKDVYASGMIFANVQKKSVRLERADLSVLQIEFLLLAQISHYLLVVTVRSSYAVVVAPVP